MALGALPAPACLVSACCAKKKKVSVELAKKSTNTKGKASKTTKKATTDEEGRKLTKCIDRALHDCVDDIGTMAEATAADCTALRPLALKLATVYKPCVLQVKKISKRLNSWKAGWQPVVYSKTRLVKAAWCLLRIATPCAVLRRLTVVAGHPAAKLMEGVGDTHGIRSRRKEDIVDWLVRVWYRLESCDHPLLSYCGVVALRLLEKHG